MAKQKTEIKYFCDPFQQPLLFILKRSFCPCILHKVCNFACEIIWDKEFQNGPSKICRTQTLKNLKGYGYGLLKHFQPMFHSFSSWKQRETVGFQVLSGWYRSGKLLENGIKNDSWYRRRKGVVYSQYINNCSESFFHQSYCCCQEKRLS